MGDDIKRLDIAEFRELGYLQEVNRLFLHLHGLALEVVVEDDGSERLGGVWDYRDDPEGMVFGVGMSDPAKAERVEADRRRHFDARCDLFGVPADIRRAVVDPDVQPLEWTDRPGDGTEA